MDKWVNFLLLKGLLTIFILKLWFSDDGGEPLFVFQFKFIILPFFIYLLLFLLFILLLPLTFYLFTFFLTSNLLVWCWCRLLTSKLFFVSLCLFISLLCMIILPLFLLIGFTLLFLAILFGVSNTFWSFDCSISFI